MLVPRLVAVLIGLIMIMVGLCADTNDLDRIGTMAFGLIVIKIGVSYAERNRRA